MIPRRHLTLPLVAEILIRAWDTNALSLHYATTTDQVEEIETALDYLRPYQPTPSVASPNALANLVDAECERDLQRKHEAHLARLYADGKPKP